MKGTEDQFKECGQAQLWMTWREDILKELILKERKTVAERQRVH